MNGHLNSFPASLANVLGKLTYLDLGGNEFTRIPEAVSRITTLKTLHLGANMNLELEIEDLRFLRALPDLETLELSKLTDDEYDNSGFSQQSVGVLIEMSYMLPGVYLAGFDTWLPDDSDE